VAAHAENARRNAWTDDEGAKLGDEGEEIKIRRIQEANKKVKRRRALFLIDLFLVSMSIGTSLRSCRRNTRVYGSYLVSPSNVQDA
jgi:hypothetical protein